MDIKWDHFDFPPISFCIAPAKWESRSLIFRFKCFGFSNHDLYDRFGWRLLANETDDYYEVDFAARKEGGERTALFNSRMSRMFIKDRINAFMQHFISVVQFTVQMFDRAGAGAYVSLEVYPTMLEEVD